MITDFEYYKSIVIPENCDLTLREEIFYFYNLLKQVVPSKAVSFLMAASKIDGTTGTKNLELTKIATMVAVRHDVMPKRDMKSLSTDFYNALEKLHKKGFAASKKELKTAKSLKPASGITNIVFAEWNWSNGQSLAMNCLIYRKELMRGTRVTKYSMLSCEHIMPQKPTGKSQVSWQPDKPSTQKAKEKWKKENFGETYNETYKRNVSNIGNHIILYTVDNKSLGNKSFTEKKKFLKDSPYKHVKDIAKKKAWTQKDIQKRGNKLFDLFEKI